MWFVSNFTARQIAAALDLPQRRIYARITKCLKHLRSRIEQQGVTRELAGSLMGWQGSDLRVDFLGHGQE
jgi:23S rRNA C2498 (ribose-2'-O)-methylase RlmM